VFIYFDISQNSYYKCQIQSEANLQSFLNLVKIGPPQFIKRNRLFLVKEYYKRVDIKAHKAPKVTELNQS